MSRSGSSDTGKRATWHLAGVLAGLAIGLTFARPATADAPASASPIEEVSETFPSHGKKVAIERFSPEAPGRYPAVIVLHGHGGIGPSGEGSPIRERARRLARQGYVALIPHYFDRTGNKLNNAVRNGRYYNIWMETVSDAVTYAGRLPQVDRRRIGLLGFSLGASVAISNGMADPRVSVVVEYAGSLVGEPPPQHPTMPPMLILHGDADRSVPVRQAHHLAAVFTEWQSPFEMKIYPGAGHGLRGEDEADAWRRTVEFLDKYLKRN